MSEKIAVVGPRKGADKEAVESFVRSLYTQQPDATLVSGGAEGVDTWAEQLWISLGGRAWSYRVRKVTYDHFVTDKWEIGGGQARIYELIAEPSWADYVSALLYRSMLVAEIADKICAFSGIDKMRGTEFTVTIATNDAHNAPVYLWQDNAWEQLQ